jgi:aryl-alcohol dehydrogenase-like predicted oxidoreductase
MEARGNRDEIVILTKGAHHNADRNRVTDFDIKSDLYDSLARLKTDHVDLYVLHRDDPSVPVGPIVEALNEHAEAGRIHAFGGSNWTVERLREANEYAEAHGLIPFGVSSPNFSLADQVEEPWPGCLSLSGRQGCEDRVWYQQSQMPVFTWSSLAQGFFSGLLTRDNFPQMEADEALTESCVRAYCHPENFDRLERAAELAQEKDVVVPQIALAYVLCHPLNSFTLIGCRSGDEMSANIEALALELTAEELAWLDLRTDTR